ncbi:MAG: alpha/beta hydrolase [Rhodospirillaceae bacterium]|nr:alpha/beta hydrolase [Rhodospirillaceae bacterium]
MRSDFLLGLGPGGFHRICYTDWGGAAAGRTVVAVHGLTRNGRDFDRLAAALSGGGGGGFRVVCPDIAGRGRSDWLPAAAHYTYPQYLADMTALIARLGAPAVDWIGTSMGGLIGMMLAAQPGSPVRRLVLNDIGPFVPRAALARIAAYVGEDPRFARLDEVEAYLRRVHAPFGRLSDADWRHLALHGHRRLDGGGFALAYDPAIGTAFREAARRQVDLWAVWEAVRCPVLVLRGESSDVLPAEVAEGMARRGPRARVFTIAGAGHAPALMSADQIAVVREWLTSAP